MTAGSTPDSMPRHRRVGPGAANQAPVCKTGSGTKAAGGLQGSAWHSGSGAAEEARSPDDVPDDAARDLPLRTSAARRKSTVTTGPAKRAHQRLTNARLSPAA